MLHTQEVSEEVRKLKIFFQNTDIPLVRHYGLEMIMVLSISVFLSVFFYLILGRIRRKILVDLGYHKWLVK